MISSISSINIINYAFAACSCTCEGRYLVGTKKTAPRAIKHKTVKMIRIQMIILAQNLIKSIKTKQTTIAIPIDAKMIFQDEIISWKALTLIAP